MVQVQRGDNRQYVATEYDINNANNVMSSLEQVAEGGIQIARIAGSTKLSEHQVDMQSKMMDINTQLNAKYQNDPFSPELEKERKEKFNELKNSYQISPFLNKEWNDTCVQMSNNFKIYNKEWAIKQEVSNIQTNLATGYDKLRKDMGMLGQQGEVDVNKIRLMYLNGETALKKGAESVYINPQQVEQSLKDMKHNCLAEYISGLAQTKPLEAEKLMKDEGFKNDIGDAKTIDTLNNYVNNAVLNYHKKVAVSQMCNALRAMNSEQSERILSGSAGISEVMKFMETHKDLHEGSKELISSIYGIGSKTEYYYDKDKSKIVKKAEGGSGGSANSLVAIKNMTKEQKDICRTNLETKLGELFFIDENENKTVSASKASKEGRGSKIIERMSNLCKAQGAVDLAYRTGIIDKSKRDSMLNKYLAPMNEYYEANLVNLDEKDKFMGTKLGYDRIKNTFSGKKHSDRKNLLNAQNCYISCLEDARKRYGLNSIYDIEKLSGKEQREIYKSASDYAIEHTKKHSEHPEIFFKEEHPTLFAQGVTLFGLEGGEELAKRVAKEIYQNPNNKSSVKEVMSKSISDMYALKFNKNWKTLVNNYDKKYGEGSIQKPAYIYSGLDDLSINPKDNELRTEYIKKVDNFNKKRMQELGVSEADVIETAKKNGMSISKVLSVLEINKNGITLYDLQK